MRATGSTNNYETKGFADQVLSSAELWITLVERRRVQAGAPRQAGGCQAMHGRKVIAGPSDLFMLQHGTYVFSSAFS